MLKRAFTAALTPALLLQFAPAHAAAPLAGKPKPPVLTCTTTTAEGLSYTVIKAGKGERPIADSRVTVDYKGMILQQEPACPQPYETRFRAQIA